MRRPANLDNVFTESYVVTRRSHVKIARTIFLQRPLDPRARSSHDKFSYRILKNNECEFGFIDYRDNIKKTKNTK